MEKRSVINNSRKTSLSPATEEALYGYVPDTEKDFYEALRPVVRLPQPPVGRIYHVFEQVLRLAVDRKLRHNKIHFAGMFAKIDYLVKEFRITSQLAIDINGARNRIRNVASTAPDELRKACRYDLKAICEFIHELYPDTAIPAFLAKFFPEDRLTTVPPRRLMGNRLRVAVGSWDDEYIYGIAEESGEQIKLCYRFDSEYGMGDWSYLRSLLRNGTQLNVVNPRENDGIVYPELLIYEPDYLVDISSVAACFETYAHDARIHLLNKIKPSVSTDAILLGNFAGQLLDEEVHSENKTYAQSIKSFFKRNALGMAACDTLGKQFHENAKQQKQNIRHALKEVLPEEVGSFDSQSLLLEPSFFCELLGIQGRMDFLQSDYQILIEQKSGKGAFPPDPDPNTPRHQERHYVQLLLYRALLHYNFGKQNKEDKALKRIYTFLLYSKYANSLLELGNAPRLLFEAFRIRNELVFLEQQYATTDGMRLLERLTPENLNTLHASGRLWEQYIRPQLNALLQPIHTATPLQRAYYLRFMAFIETEHLLAKVGNKTKEGSGFAAVWNDSVEEKRQAGNIYDNLSLAPIASEGKKIDTVTLLFAQQMQTDTSNFRTGDIVILYPYPANSEPDARQTMVFRATITDIQTDCIRLALRHPQTDKRVFMRPQNDRWAVEHDFFESSFGALYRGLHAFLSASQARKDLILAQRAPQQDTHLALQGDYGAFNELVLRAKQARDFFLIIGPPGTGKTSFGLLNVLKEELLLPSSAVLLTAYTNRAVDEICSKLCEAGIDFLRIGSSLNCEERYRGHLLEERVQQCDTVSDVKELIARTRVVCATTSALNANIALLTMKRFDLAVIDEASQILEPHIIGLLCAQCGGKESIGRFVMIGDHKQLPAVVQQTTEESRTDEPELHAIHLTDCRLSLFERLLKTYRNNASVVYMLTRQGRMHRDIARFPSQAFYGNALQTVPLPHQERVLAPVLQGAKGIEALLLTRRIAFLNASAMKDESAVSDKTNKAEAEMIAATTVAAYRLHARSFNVAHTIGIIVPYRNQIATVRNAIDRYGIKCLHDITIDTVERYQGSQRDIIIYGFTVSKRYQLDFLCNNVFEEDGAVIDRKLNVAMTRAREHLILIGNALLLQDNRTFAQLIAFIRNRQSFFDIAPHVYCRSEFTLTPVKEAETKPT
ncbi:ATP-binding protein [Hoylesella oralis]|uniref:DEAD/DEAH box helicase n=1 Tax=Hoylesella oralis TaxID=28134 RepID=UPI0028EBAD67|nr:ATP-binding protein [Hoylesella oralis]